MSYELLKEKIRGPVFPIVTPFTVNHELDLHALRHYLDWLYAGGARIFHVMVHTSRFSLLTVDEMIRVNTCVARHVRKNFSDDCIVILADPLCKSTKMSVEFAQHAEDVGADLIGLIFTERYYTSRQPLEFFETVANSCNIGILIHEQPMASIDGVKTQDWPIFLLKKICEIENVIAIKEDSKSDSFTAAVCRNLYNKVAIITSGGSKEQFLKFGGPYGAQAYLVGIGSFDPTVSDLFYQLWCRGDLKSCWEMVQDIERPFFSAAKSLGWHPALKSALSILGLMSRVERPPLCQLTDAAHASIQRALKRIGIK